MYYSNLKLFNYREKLEQMRRGIITAPVHIRIKPTNTCNHRCWYCGYQSDTAIDLGGDLNTKDFIPKDKMVEICDDLKEMQVKAVTFSGGGEPLTYKHFDEFADRLLGSHIKVALLTNGALLSGSHAEVLANRATWVRVSMDGWDDPSYRDYRGVKGEEFSKIIRNLACFAGKKGTTVLGVSLNLDQKNYTHVYDLAKTLKESGVDHVKVCGCIVSNDGAENNRYHEPFFKDASNEIARAQEDLNDLGFQVFNVYHEMQERFRKSYQNCPFAQFLTVIAADLNVYTCQDKAYTETGKLGSIRDVRFKDLWFDGGFQDCLRRINPSKICNHHCVADCKNRLIFDYLSLKPDHIDFV